LNVALGDCIIKEEADNRTSKRKHRESEASNATDTSDVKVFEAGVCF
jgi:hypothetical protein